jgi:phosphate transport system substrate-binding protein
VDPRVVVAVSGGGTGTGIASLANNTVDIANASRELKNKERTMTRKSTGKEPLEHVVAFDAIAIYVHPSNPLRAIDRQQLGCIYGEKGTCQSWTDLGIEVPGCAEQKLIRVSRQNNSGTYGFFREWVLGTTQDFKLGSLDMQGSKDVVDLVEQTPCAIGYSGIGYKTDKVKTLCLSSEKGLPCIKPNVATAANGSYPIARALYMYTLGKPQGVIAQYINWIKSNSAQKIVEQVGFAPLPSDKRTKL